MRLILDFRRRSKGFAYIDFDSPPLALSAARLMNGYCLNQRAMKVLPSKPTKHLYEEKTLFLSGIPQELKEEKDVEEALGSLGFQDITAVRLIREGHHHQHQGKSESGRDKGESGEKENQQSTASSSTSRRERGDPDEKKSERVAGESEASERSGSRRGSTSTHSAREEEEDVTMERENKTKKREKEDEGMRTNTRKGEKIEGGRTKPSKPEEGANKDDEEDVMMLEGLRDEKTKEEEKEGMEKKHKG